MKQPPSEMEIEKSVLVSILIDPEHRKQALESLDVNHFYSNVNQIIFKKCSELQLNGHAVGIPEVWTELSDDQREKIGNATKLASLIDSHPISVDIQFHISKLKECAARRRTLELTNSIEKRCYRKGSDLNKVDRDARIIIDEIQSTTAETDRSSFEFIHNAGIIENLQPVQWRIRDIMEDNAFYYDFGDAGNYKTFVELDRLLCVATGNSYHGHPVKQGTVFYIAGEGQQGIGRRVASWHIHHGIKAAEVPFFIAKTPTQLMDLRAVEEVKKAVDVLAAKYGSPAIIHIDRGYRCMCFSHRTVQA